MSESEFLRLWKAAWAEAASGTDALSKATRYSLIEMGRSDPEVRAEIDRIVPKDEP